MDSSLVEGIILNVLRGSEDPLTIIEIAQRAKIHRVTASKYLSLMEAKGIVRMKNVGKAKLYSIKRGKIDLYSGGNGYE